MPTQNTLYAVVCQAVNFVLKFLGIPEQTPVLLTGNNATHTIDFSLGLVNNNIGDFPGIKVVLSSEINGLDSTFSLETGKIYLAKEFIEVNIDNLNVIVAVLLDTYKRYIEKKIELENIYVNDNTNILFESADDVSLIQTGEYDEEFNPQRLITELSNDEENKDKILERSGQIQFSNNVKQDELNLVQQEETILIDPIASSDTIIERTISEVSINPETQLESTEVVDNLTVVFAENLQIQENSELDLVYIYEIVDTALQDSYQYLSQFRFDPDYIEKLETAFGNDFEQEIADELFDKFAQGNFADIPTIKIVNRQEIYGGNGAFSVDTGLAYLAVEFIIENQENIFNITDVLLEEKGHFIDNKINIEDSEGDEGDIFSELVQGNIINKQELQYLKAEDDTTTIILEGEEIAIEQNFDPTTINQQNLHWNLQQINVWDAWMSQNGGATGRGTTIAILDEFPAVNEPTHGSQVSSVTSANNPNLNVFGVAPNANHLQLEVTQNTIYDAHLVIQRFEEAINNNANVINMSFNFFFDAQNAENQKIELRNLINDAANRNIIVTVAAGNYGQDWSAGWLDPNHPLYINNFQNSFAKFLADNQFPNVILVGATNETGRIADLSNYDSSKTTLPVNLAAPSGDGDQPDNSITVLRPDGVSTQQVIGTSFAAPHVAGAVALIKEHFGNLDYNLTKELLSSTVDQNRNTIRTNRRGLPAPNPNDYRSLQTGMVWEGSLNIGNIFNRYSVETRFTHEMNNGQTVGFSGIWDQNLNKWHYLIKIIIRPPANAPRSLSASNIQDNDPDFDSFSPLLVIGGDGANVSLDGDILTINGVVSAAVGGIAEYPLFRLDDFQVDLSNGFVVALGEAANGVNNGFTLLGLNVKFQNFKLLENGITLNAKLTAPELGILEDAEVDINDISISTDGLSVGNGSFSPWTGKREFDAFGLMKVAVDNPTLSFDFQEEVGTLHGQLYIPTFDNLNVNLSKEKGLKFRQGQNGNSVEYAMDVTIQNGIIPIYGDWKLDNINLDLKKDFDDSTITGVLGATLHTSKDNSITITGGYQKPQETDNNGVFKFTANSGDGTDFTLFGTDVDINGDITFVSDIDPSNEVYWEPELTLASAVITLPESLGTQTNAAENKERLKIDLKKLKVSQEGFSLGDAQVNIPDFDVNLLGLLEVKGKEITLAYKNEDQEKYFKIQGQVSLPSFYDITADFTGSNYIEIGDNGVKVVGKIYADNIVIEKGVWEIKHAELDIDTNQNKVEAKAKFLIPTGIELDGDVVFQSGELSYIDIKAEHLNRPIGETGAFLQSIEGKYEDKNPTPGPENVSSVFSGDIGFTAGPKINIDLPSWLGGGFHGSLMKFDVHGKVTSDYIQADGHVKVLGGLIQGDAKAELNWTKEYLFLESHFNIFDGLITTKTDLLAKWDDHFKLYLFGEAKVFVPHFVPFWGGTELASGEVFFQYTDDGNYSNDYVATWGNTWLGTIGINVSFDGNWHLIWHDEAEKITNHAKSIFNSINFDFSQRKEIGDNLVTAPTVLKKIIQGTNGDDQLHGDDRRDEIDALAGNDLLWGAGGADILNGDENDDVLHGGAGDDVLNGGTGDDVLYGDEGADKFDGGDGDDHIYTDKDDFSLGFQTVIKGGNGNDTIFIEDQAITIGKIPTVSGGEGDDKFVFSFLRVTHVEGGEGTDTVSYSSLNDDLSINLDKYYGYQYNPGENSLDTGNTPHILTSMENAIGGSGDDTIKGNHRNNLLEGGAGADEIFGEAGNDTIDGGIGEDTLSGGSGADIFFFDSRADGIDEIKDLNPSQGDRIHINIDAFGPVAPHLFDYDPSTGALYYDEFQEIITKRSLYLLSDAGTWEEAQAQAQSLGGNLVTINNQEEQDWLHTAFPRESYGWLWIGLTDHKTEGTFEWISGETSSYTNWNPVEPNDAYGSGEDYTIMNYENLWNDLSGQQSLQGIIEIPAENYKQYKGRFYLLSDSGTWEQAQTKAESLGGNLVTINNQEEEDWLKETFGNDQLWIGLTDKETEGTFKWINGEALNYTNWAPNQPNNDGYQDYVGMNWGDNNQWNDYKGQESLQGIIEIPIEPDQYFQTDFEVIEKKQLATLSNKPQNFDTNNHINIDGTYVELFADNNYNGQSLYLTPGSYTYTDLFSNGFNENILSSLKIPNGWEVALYDGDDFDNQLGNYTNNIPSLPSAVNDKTTSLIVSSPGDDILNGGAGDDILNGGAGDDTLNGGAGDDILNGSAGDDILNGGTDIDTANYSSDPAGVTINLSNGTATDGRGGSDSLSNIENVTGGKFDDDITGNNLGNTLEGGAGNDILNGGAGNDTLEGGAGNDILNGGAGNDDLARFSDYLTNYIFTVLDDGRLQIDHEGSNNEGIDVLTGIEKIKFLDKTIETRDVLTGIELYLNFPFDKTP